MRFLFFCGVFFCFINLIGLQTLSAATLYIDPGLVTLYRGDAYTASVRIMPDEQSGECINAVDAVISYPSNIQPVDVSIGRSILSVWVEAPVINRENRTITFAGGIPNGYCGRVQGDPSLTNNLVDIIFRSPGLQIGSTDEGNTAVISFTNETQVYLNDGQGTKAELVTLPSTVTLDRSAGAGIVDKWRDDVRADDQAPEEFSITLEKDSIAFAGKYFIVFSTSDKQTGISHYEVIEEPLAEKSLFKWGGSDAPWVRTESPYVLRDQTLSSTIRVKAFDKAGNEYIATLVPDPELRTTSNTQVLILGLSAIAFVLVLGLIIASILLYRRKRRQSTADEISSSAEIE
jgi:hypothetical protein